MYYVNEFNYHWHCMILFQFVVTFNKNHHDFVQLSSGTVTYKKQTAGKQRWTPELSASFALCLMDVYSK